MKTLARARALRFAPLLALSLAAGCSDLGLDTGGGDVAGLTIQDGGGTLVTVGAGGSVSGGVSVARTQQRALTIVLRSAGGGVVAPGLGQSIRVSVTNPGVASWTESGTGTGVLRGVAAGGTSMRVDLMDSGTAVYTSPLIAIQVT